MDHIGQVPNSLLENFQVLRRASVTSKRVNSYELPGGVCCDQLCGDAPIAAYFNHGFSHMFGAPERGDQANCLLPGYRRIGPVVQRGGSQQIRGLKRDLELIKP